MLAIGGVAEVRDCWWGTIRAKWIKRGLRFQYQNCGKCPLEGYGLGIDIRGIVFSTIEHKLYHKQTAPKSLYNIQPHAQLSQTNPVSLKLRLAMRISKLSKSVSRAFKSLRCKLLIVVNHAVLCNTTYLPCTSCQRVESQQRARFGEEVPVVIRICD